MVQYYRDNIQMFIIFYIWLLVGMYGGVAIYGILPLTMILMKRKDMDEELLIGYLFILVLSDSQENSLRFAKNLKNVYVSMLAVFVFLDFKNYKSISKLHKIFIPFFAIALITMSTSYNERFFFTSVQKTISFILSFLIIPNLVLKLYDEEGADFFKRIILFVFTILVVGIILRFVAPSTALLLGQRFRGVFGGPNGLGIFCVLSFIVAFILNDFFPDMFMRFERIIILASILISLYWSGSRNAVISVLIFYLFQRFFSLSPFLGFIIFLITFFVSEYITSNAAQIVSTLGLQNYFRLKTLEEGSGRYVAWAFAWKQIQHNFFIGKGFAYNEFYMRQHYHELGLLGHQGGIHNSFLTFWMDQGLFGLVIYLRSYLLVFISAAKKTKFAFPVMFAISFSAFFESWLVGSLSAFAFIGMFIFTLITSEEIVPKTTEEDIETESKIKTDLAIS